MKVNVKDHSTVIEDTNNDTNFFLVSVSNLIESYKSQNLILDLTQNKTTTMASIKAFSGMAKTHKKGKKSFVIVAQNIDFNAVPKSLIVVPTVLEAHDIIEMEEIERDLGF